MLVKSKEDITPVLVNLYAILSWNKYYNLTKVLSVSAAVSFEMSQLSLYEATKMFLTLATLYFLFMAITSAQTRQTVLKKALCRSIFSYIVLKKIFS